MIVGIFETGLPARISLIPGRSMDQLMIERYEAIRSHLGVSIFLRTTPVTSHKNADTARQIKLATSPAIEDVQVQMVMAATLRRTRERKRMIEALPVSINTKGWRRKKTSDV